MQAKDHSALRINRDLFSVWCRDIGCSVGVDAIGNMFARRVNGCCLP